MQKYDASSWEIYYGRIPSRRRMKKDKKKARVDAFNSNIVGNARKNAKSMRKEPSVLEQKMKLFLDTHGIYYEFQKVLFIKDEKGYVKRYYIADFFIPKKCLIIETDGKFHDNQVELDEERTKDIMHYYGDYQIIRWRWHDFQSINKIRNLLAILK